MSKTLSKTHKRGTHSGKKKTVKKNKSVYKKTNSRKTRKGNKSGKRKGNKSGKGKSNKSGKGKSNKSGKKKSNKSGKRKSKSKSKDLLRLYGGSRRCGSDHVFVPGINIEGSIPSVEPLYLEDKMALIEDKVILKKVDHARHN